MILLTLGGLVAIILLVLTLWLYTPDKTRAELEAAYPGEYLVLDGVRLRLRDTGPRDAPAVIMLHGFGSSLDTWEPWAQALSPRFRVIRFDLPGFGLTGPDPTNDYTDTRTVALLVVLMDQLGIERASLIGNSLGGRIAWTFAATKPDRTARLVLVSPDGFASPGFAYDVAPETPMMMRALPYAAPRSLLRTNLVAAYAEPKALSETNLTRYSDMLRAPGVRRAILKRMDQTILREPGPMLERINAPTLLVWGERDNMIPIDNALDYQRHIPQARVVRLPDVGHLPFEERPEASLHHVEQFLAPALS